jgi:protein-tyrosine phosphatase
MVKLTSNYSTGNLLVDIDTERKDFTMTDLLDPADRLITINGYGTITETEWSDLQPAEIATLLPIPGMPALHIGETPEDEDWLTAIRAAIESAPDLSSEQILMALDRSKVYTQAICDFRVDLYGAASLSPAGVSYVRAPFPDGWLDATTADILLDLAARVYTAWSSGVRVAVNCQAGLNRSSLLVSMLLIRHGFSAQEAIDFLRAERSPLCLVNQHFVDFLLENEKAIATHKVATGAAS